MLARDFWPPTPNRAQPTGIAHMPTRESCLYLIVVVDLFSHRRVSWAMSEHLDR
ncbi:hypothetical protein K8640_23765 [Myxococcus sp. XM-1-1-1]|uniref:hypothetical protein n=1 Tax=Myxococcus sp. XM-1-1-1 TaxID=2874602 RepID=UPI001CBC19FE|nr:hypothetical protein [Myxococcus sp. XM-1-1-1]MBZ4411235.1 hypothetical protein [Myxococcus sp. XM-1-1-1]